MAAAIRENPERLIEHLARIGGTSQMPPGDVIRLSEEENAAVRA